MAESTTWEKYKVLISILSILLTIIVAMGVFTYLPGEAKIFKPTAFGVIGGKDAFPSDMFILSIPWENTGGQYITVTKPHLNMERINGQNSSEVFNFVLAGEMTDLSSNSFHQGYQNKFSFILSPHSRTDKVLVFQPEGYWNTTDPEKYFFTFKKNEQYRVTLGYYQDSSEKSNIYLFHAPIYDAAANVNRTDNEGNWYEFFQTEDQMFRS